MRNIAPVPPIQIRGDIYTNPSFFAPCDVRIAKRYLVEHVIDTSVFDEHYINDETGAPSLDPEVLLKVVCYGHAWRMIRAKKGAGMN